MKSRFRPGAGTDDGDDLAQGKSSSAIAPKEQSWFEWFTGRKAESPTIDRIKKGYEAASKLPQPKSGTTKPKTGGPDPYAAIRGLANPPKKKTDK